MEVERIPASALIVGDVVAFRDRTGWWSISDVRRESARLIVTISSIDDEQSREHWLDDSDEVLRTDPDAVHHRAEFLGLTVEQARAYADATGWTFRDHTGGGWLTVDLRRDRIDVWADESGVVVRAEMG